jgi:hypothetical protein
LQLPTQAMTVWFGDGRLPAGTVKLPDTTPESLTLQVPVSTWSRSSRQGRPARVVWPETVTTTLPAAAAGCSVSGADPVTLGVELGGAPEVTSATTNAALSPITARTPKVHPEDRGPIAAGDT